MIIPLHQGFRKTLSPHPPTAPSSLGTPFPGISYGACEIQPFRSNCFTCSTRWSDFAWESEAYEKNHCKLAKPAHLCPCKGWKAVYVWDLGVNYYRNCVLEQKCVGHSVTSAPIFCAEHKEHGVGWVHNHLKTWLNWLCSVFQQELPLSRNQAWRAQAHMEVICCKYDDLRFEKRGISLSISFHTS